MKFQISPPAPASAFVGQAGWPVPGHMTLAALILLTLKTSIILNVFGLGLTAAPQDPPALLRRPALLVRSLIPMFVIMPLLAALIAAALSLHPAVKIGLIALAVSPVPPLLPKRGLRPGEEASYAFGLLVAAGLLATVLTPLALKLIGQAFGKDVHVSFAPVTKLVLMTVVLPLGAGILVRRLAPEWAKRLAKPVVLVSGILLLGAALPVLFTAWHAMVSLIGNGTLAAIAAFVLVGLGAGHIFGGPNRENKTVLAMSTACRHPAIAMTVASAAAPNQKLVPAAILLYLLVSAVLSLLYIAWEHRAEAMPQPSPQR